jgi:hypothetical protein
MATFCWAATAVIATVAFAAMLLVPLTVSITIPIPIGVVLFMVFGGNIGLGSAWSIVFLCPERKIVRLAVANWKALKFAESCVAADATIEGGVKVALGKRFKAIRSGCGGLQESFNHLEELLGAIAEQEKAVSGAADNSKEKRAAELRLGDLKSELSKWANNDLRVNTVYAMRKAEEEFKKDSPNCREVVRWLLCAEDLLRQPCCPPGFSDYYTRMDEAFKAKAAYGAICGALHDLGIEPDATDKIREPGAFDKVLCDTGEQLSSYGGRQRM